MSNKLANKVVVLTGASSGIGRAAALQFADEGAHVVLAARRAPALEAAAEECARRGVRALAVPTDVSDSAAVEALVEVALAEFGRVDVWVNDAGVYMMGELQDVPLDVHQRVVEVNLLGVLYGMRAILPHMRARGEGVIINVASMAGKAPYAYASTYCATKAAVRALTEAVRQEQRGQRGRVDVCAVSPPAVCTPLFDHAANFTGRAIKPPKPVYSVERAARVIVRCAERPRRELSVGVMPIVMGLFRTLAKPLYERIAPLMMRHQHLAKRPAAEGPGNLFLPAAHDLQPRQG